jgi:hypothetical protein
MADISAAIGELALTAASAKIALDAFDHSARGANSDLRQLDSSIERLTSAMRDLQSSINVAHQAGPSSSSSSTAKESAENSQAIAQVAASISNAAGPLQRLGATMVGMVNQVGGTITTLARRIDASMKFDTSITALDKLRESASNNFRKMLIDAGKAALAIQNYFSSSGDVARHSLMQLTGSNFGPAVSSALTLNRAVGAIRPTTVSATGAVVAFGRQLLIALGVFGVAFKVVQFFHTAIGEASAFSETIDKVNTVFGAAAGTILSQSDAMAAKFGIAKREFSDAAASIGEMGLAARMSQKDAAAFGVQFAKLAADFASQDNLSFEEAAAKLRSALAGESEPLRRYGVLIDEDTVKLYAYASGLAKAGHELTNSQKVQARAALIMQGLSRVQGDLERTSGSAANQFRRAGGGLTNFAQIVGSLLLPAVKQALASFNELLATTIEVFENNKGTFAGWAGNIAEAFDTVAMVARNFGDVWEIVKLTAIEKLSNVMAYLESFRDSLGIIGSWIKDNWMEILANAFNDIGQYFLNLGFNATKLYVALKDLFAGKGFNFDWTPLLTNFKTVAMELPELMKPATVSMEEGIDAAMARIAEREAKLAAQLKANAEKSAGGAGSGAAAASERLLELSKKVKEYIDDAKTPLDKFQEKIKDLQEMRAAKLIDDATFNKVAGGAAQEFARDSNEGRKPYAGALTANSREARSAILEHRMAGDRDPVKQVEKAIREQTAIQKEQLVGIKRLSDILGSKEKTEKELGLPL